MPQPKRHTDHAARQAAYRKRQEAERKSSLSAKSLLPLPTIPSMPGNARWNQILDNAAQMLQVALDEMQDYFDERSEAWQESDRGEWHQERTAAVEEIVGALEAVQR